MIRPLIRVLYLLVLAVLTLLTSLITHIPGFNAPDFATPTPEHRCYATVLVDSLNVRTGPGLQYPVFATLQAGAIVEVAARATVAGDVWYQFADPEVSGWSAGFFRGNVYLEIPAAPVCELPSRTISTAPDSHAIP